MLLVFPTNYNPADYEVKTIRSLNKEEFHKEIELLQASGWEVQEMYSKFRKTLFGGVISYRAELRRGISGSKKK